MLFYLSSFCLSFKIQCVELVKFENGIRNNSLNRIEGKRSAKVKHCLEKLQKRQFGSFIQPKIDFFESLKILWAIFWIIKCKMDKNRIALTWFSGEEDCALFLLVCTLHLSSTVSVWALVVDVGDWTGVVAHLHSSCPTPDASSDCWLEWQVGTLISSMTVVG